jgi:hypothetical protein
MLNGDSRKRVTWNLAAGRETSAGGASSFNASGGVSAQVSDRWAGSIGASYYASRATAQWIENRETADGAVEHIYGALDQDVLDLTLRASYALTRDLTLEGYLQPFVAVGDYGAIGRLARPRSRDFEPTALAHDPDFSVTSLRGNVVLRWEYRPGSPLFVVWNLSQAAESQPGDFRPWRDLGAAFGATPSSTFLVKTSWWIAK